MSEAQSGDVYRLVFELTARATDVPYPQFLKELAEGLAAHYQASVCRLHIGDDRRAAASVDVTGKLAELDSDDRSRFDTLDSLLASSVRSDNVLKTALDLDGGDEVVNFLARKLMTPETFAFPLIARGRAFGAITFYLLDSYPFSEADVRGLQAIGNVLYAASNKSGAIASSGPAVSVTSDKLRVYQENLDRVGKILDELLFLTDARSVLLLDALGNFIAKRGEESQFSSTDFAAVVASGFAAAQRLSSFYGAHEQHSVLHEGEDESAFVIEVTPRVLLCIVYEGHEAPGLIGRWSHSAASRLAEHYEQLTESEVI